MKGLIIKDLLLMKNKLTEPKYLIFLAIYLLLIFTIFNTSFITFSILLIFLLINGITHVYINEKESGLLEYIYVTTDLSPSQVVLARYVSSILLSFLYLIFFVVISTINNMIFNQYTLREMGIILAVVLGFSLFYILLSTPFIYAFLENGFLVLTLLLTIVGVGATQLPASVLNQVLTIEQTAFWLIGGVVLVILSIIFISVSKAVVTYNMKKIAE